MLLQVTEALLWEHQKIKQSNQKLCRFSSVVSQDILNNLEFLLSAGHVLGGRGASKEHLRQYYSLVHQTSLQLKDYCTGLLEEARNTAAEREEAIGPMPVLQKVLGRYAMALQAAGFEVEAHALSPVLLPAPGLEQLFQNLVSNALRYAADGAAPFLRIQESQTAEGRICWQFEDQGPGVATHLREAIFQHSGGVGGKEMGLGMLRAALLEHGAEIWVEQASSGGAMFVVAFIG